MVDVAARRQCHALAHIALANTLVKAMLGNTVGQFCSMVKRDDAEHHVDGRCATGASQAPGVDL